MAKDYSNKKIWEIIEKRVPSRHKRWIDFKIIYRCMEEYQKHIEREEYKKGFKIFDETYKEPGVNDFNTSEKEIEKYTKF